MGQSARVYRQARPLNYDLDVHQSAAALIEELAVFAANQAQALLGFGDMNGYRRWNQIQMASYEQLWSPNWTPGQDQQRNGT